MSTHRWAPFIVILAFTASCSLYHREVLQVDPTPRTATVVDSVRVLAQEPAQTYKVVALVSVSTHVGNGDLRYMTGVLAVEAAQLGANGILVGPESITATEDERFMTGRAILFDSIAPPLTPGVGRVPGRGRTLAAVALLSVALVPGIMAIIRADDPPEIPQTPSLP
jgi:hypothetical protein